MSQRGESMRKNKSTLFAVLLTLFATVPGSLAADEMRNSFSIIGGAGFYEYRVHPDPASVFFYEMAAVSFPSAASNPLRLLSDMEAYSPMTIEGKQGLGRLQYEHLFLDSKSLGLTAGLSYAGYSEKCVENCGTYTRLLFLQSMGPSSVTILMFNPGMLQESSADFTLTTLDVGLNYHFSADSMIAPYVGVGAGLGTCSISGAESGTLCTGVKYGARLGTRINFSQRVFMTLQTEIDRVELSIAGPSGFGKAVQPVPSKQILAGIGFNF